MDPEVIDENEQLLVPRWRFLRANSDPQCFRHLGFDPASAAALHALEEVQVVRAANAASPLFRAAVPDEVLIQLLTHPPEHLHQPLHDAERLIEVENETWLLNRWAAARLSAPHTQVTYGLTTNLTGVLREARLTDVQRACRGGSRLAAYMGRDRYLLHAGRHPGLCLSQRTIMAACAARGSKL
jgi:hypothetical protein